MSQVSILNLKSVPIIFKICLQDFYSRIKKFKLFKFHTIEQKGYFYHRVNSKQLPTLRYIIMKFLDQYTFCKCHSCLITNIESRMIFSKRCGKKMYIIYTPMINNEKLESFKYSSLRFLSSIPASYCCGNINWSIRFVYVSLS